jgi:hypothetical protein
MMAFALIILNAVPSRAQDIITGTGRQQLSNPGSARPPKRASRRYGTVAPIVRYLTKEVLVMPTTGTLFISTESNANIVVEPVAGGESEESTIPKDERFFIFANLKPGRYRVAAALDGHHSGEKEVTVERNKATGVTLDLKPITYKAVINTNISSGRILYAPVEDYLDARTGEKKYRAIGATIQVRIENRRALLTNLRRGIYGVDIKADEVGYETLLGTISVPDATNEETVTLNVNLKNTRSTANFSAMTSDQWELPPTWSFASQKLSVRGRGVALPRLANYRYYTDFELVSDVKMRNQIAVSFVARAADKENYYLIQLTGAKAGQPYQLRGFIVKKGVAQAFGSVPIPHFANALDPKHNFRISITMKDNSTSVSLLDNQTGIWRPLGGFTDSNGHYPIGAVGIAAEDEEQNELGSFNVCTPKCAQQ